MKYSKKIKNLIPLSLLPLLFIQAPHILAQTLTPAPSHSNTNTNTNTDSNLTQDVKTINDILVKQGNLNSSIKVSHSMIVATQFHYALSTQSDCSLTLQISNNTVTQHDDSNSNNDNDNHNHSHDKTDYLKEVFNDTFTLQNISSIDVKPTVSPDNKNITYGGSYYHFNFTLNHSITPVRVFHESSLPDDLTHNNNHNNNNNHNEKALNKFNILVDNHEDTLKIMDAFNHMQTICSTHFPVHAPDVNMA